LPGASCATKAFWRDARRVYAGLIRGHNNFEIAETFYNSVYNAVFDHGQIRNEYAFVFSSQGDIPLSDSSRVLRYYRVSGSLDDTLRELLEDYSFHCPTRISSATCSASANALECASCPPRFELDPHDMRFEVLRSHFYRNKGAYIVGRVLSGHAQHAVRAAPRAQRGGWHLRRHCCWSAPIACPWYSVLRAPISWSTRVFPRNTCCS
jgi:isocitrate dehydrogenase kinase/phosphatase